MARIDRFVCALRHVQDLVLLCLIVAALVAARDDSGGVDPRPAIGFHLGQSYGTAAAHLANGTVIELAKVDGSPAYRAFMQHELLRQQDSDLFAAPPRTPATRAQLAWLLNEYLGFEDEAEVLAVMLRALRTASEEALGAEPLPATVVLGAPYMRAWQDEETSDRSIVARARRLAGLPHIQVQNMDPVYLAEAHAVLAANGQELCQHRRCYGSLLSKQDPFRREVIYLISLTDQSLYTSFQLATCYFLTPVGGRLGTINPDFGLRKQDHTFSRDDDFWYEFEEYVVARWVDHAADGDNYRGSYTVLLAGEGADDAKFQRAVEKAMARIAVGSPDAERETGPPPRVSLLVSQDPSFAAARGVALWRRTMMDGKYCADFDEPAGWEEDEGDVYRDEL
ncbi:hypothetical protein LMH87_010467 [Akanthomyces muscarius]|uniref:Uncharacterized protein n=1 Tax=Akanthomyces muscarius TaxID=2231603 RepID=A0A9W8UM12_AKAMU|nr:hypothetical protein LMH87_010467 [Akanthomyces muscarius]KAJ4154003.1 hypothetical protein LMH87_010467 [Akanthomyces muscarius]